MASARQFHNYSPSLLLSHSSELFPLDSHSWQIRSQMADKAK